MDSDEFNGDSSVVCFFVCVGGRGRIRWCFCCKQRSTRLAECQFLNLEYMELMTLVLFKIFTHFSAKKLERMLNIYHRETNIFHMVNDDDD